LEQYFAVNPGIKINKLAEAYDFAHFVADSQEQLEDVIDRFLSHEHKAILEIVTPPDVSGEILRQYMNRK
jgi:2-succinyl-5-enolpyruvyl-6-hydroxy-3-cyclohexene-1-carboxylate synthase